MKTNYFGSVRKCAAIFGDSDWSVGGSVYSFGPDRNIQQLLDKLPLNFTVQTFMVPRG